MNVEPEEGQKTSHCYGEVCKACKKVNPTVRSFCARRKEMPCLSGSLQGVLFSLDNKRISNRERVNEMQEYIINGLPDCGGLLAA